MRISAIRIDSTRVEWYYKGVENSILKQAKLK